MFGSDVLHRLISVAVGFRCSCVLVARDELIYVVMSEAANDGFIGDLCRSGPRGCRVWTTRLASQLIESTDTSGLWAVAAAWAKGSGLSDGFRGKSRRSVGGCTQPVRLLCIRDVVQERERPALALQQVELRVNRWRTTPALILGCGSLSSPDIFSWEIVLANVLTYRDLSWGLLTELSIQNPVRHIQGVTLKGPAPPRQRWYSLSYKTSQLHKVSLEVLIQQQCLRHIDIRIIFLYISAYTCLQCPVVLWWPCRRLL